MKRSAPPVGGRAGRSGECESLVFTYPLVPLPHLSFRRNAFAVCRLAFALDRGMWGIGRGTLNSFLFPLNLLFPFAPIRVHPRLQMIFFTSKMKNIRMLAQPFIPVQTIDSGQITRFDLEFEDIRIASDAFLIL